mmetsp:Transcript_116061/g.374952  ORF Transcript_116061/g.374952 Transcript_116061/m.374952 type:complete len:357 (+) Transcript_116061:1-1071(+)
MPFYSTRSKDLHAAVAGRPGPTLAPGIPWYSSANAHTMLVRSSGSNELLRLLAADASAGSSGPCNAVRSGCSVSAQSVLAMSCALKSAAAARTPGPSASKTRSSSSRSAAKLQRRIDRPWGENSRRARLETSTERATTRLSEDLTKVANAQAALLKCLPWKRSNCRTAASLSRESSSASSQWSVASAHMLFATACGLMSCTLTARGFWSSSRALRPKLGLAPSSLARRCTAVTTLTGPRLSLWLRTRLRMPSASRRAAACKMSSCRARRPRGALPPAPRAWAAMRRQVQARDLLCRPPVKSSSRRGMAEQLGPGLCRFWPGACKGAGHHARAGWASPATAATSREVHQAASEARAP